MFGYIERIHIPVQSLPLGLPSGGTMNQPYCFPTWPTQPRRNAWLWEKSSSLFLVCCRWFCPSEIFEPADSTRLGSSVSETVVHIIVRPEPSNQAVSCSLAWPSGSDGQLLIPGCLVYLHYSHNHKLLALGSTFSLPGSHATSRRVYSIEEATGPCNVFPIAGFLLFPRCQ